MLDGRDIMPTSPSAAPRGPDVAVCPADPGRGCPADPANHPAAASVLATPAAPRAAG